MRLATDQETRTKLANRLKARRRQLGLTQEEMAAKIPEIKYVTYQRWEQGAAFPDIDNLRRAQETMGIELTDLAAGQFHEEDGNFLKEALTPLQEEIARLRAELEAMRAESSARKARR